MFLKAKTGFEEETKLPDKFYESEATTERVIEEEIKNIEEEVEEPFSNHSIDSSP